MKYLWMKNGMTGYLTSNADMEAAASDGAAVIAEGEDGEATAMLYDGTKWICDQPDIDGERQSFVIVAPEYVDARMVAVVDVFEALAADLYPVAAVMTMDAESDVDAAAARAESGFAAAVARLKGLVYGKQD